MTERLYYHDAYTTEFHANVVEQRIIEGQPVVILDRTYFYPTGGGQPHDLGTIDGISVVEVLTDEAGKSIMVELNACTIWVRHGAKNPTIHFSLTRLD